MEKSSGVMKDHSDQNPIRILIVDDHPIVRAGLAMLLANEPSFTLAGSVASGESALAFLGHSAADIVLLDLRMPGTSGLEILPLIRKLESAPKVIILSSFNFDEDVYQAAKNGAQGYLVKDASHDEILETIRSVAAGRQHFPKDLADQIAEREGRSGLSPRELEVLDMVAKGLTNKEIARAFLISQFTVRTHVKHIFEKLGATDRTEAVLIAAQQGILSLQS
jgi:DNA-binding NarL/FixJ family response regulator